MDLFQIQHADVLSWPLDEFIVCLKLPRIKYANNDLISYFGHFGIQISIFTDMIFKFITSEATVELLYSTIGGVHEMRSCYRRIVVK